MAHSIKALEAANLIQRFLEDRPAYPQEWNDIVESQRVAPEVEAFKRRCFELDPLVNCPGEPDQDAVIELKNMAEALRRLTA